MIKSFISYNFNITSTKYCGGPNMFARMDINLFFYKYYFQIYLHKIKKLYKYKNNILRYIMKYCLRCGKGFRSDALKRHLENNKICPANYLNINRSEILSSYNDYGDVIAKIINDQNIEPKKNIMICKYCNKEYNKKSSYYYHINTCKNAKTYNILNKYQEEYILNKVKLLDSTDENEIKMIAERQNLLKNIIDELDPKIKNNNSMNNITVNNNSTNDNSINNITVNNTTNNNITNIINNFYINPFGKENVNHITDKEWIEILSKKSDIIPNLFHKIYIGAKENMNVYIPYPKNNYGMIFDGNIWKVLILNDILNKITVNTAFCACKYVSSDINNEIDPSLTDYIKSDEGIMFDLHDKSFIDKKILPNIKNILLTYRKDVKANYEDNTGKKLVL